MHPAAAINGSAKPNVSSGDVLTLMTGLAKQELPANMATEWTELAFIEERSRDTGFAVFGISVAVVFLVLAFLYESWALPLAVILVVPMCVACSLAGVWLTTLDTVPADQLYLLWQGKPVWNPAFSLGLARPGEVFDFDLSGRTGVARQDVNIFTQVGFVVLIGLACKNAILIVEFAKRRRDEGADRRTAILDACSLRLRPILMTSVAFILGVVPLVRATGAGAEMRVALGVAVFSGMLGVTLFGVFLTPVFFVLVDAVTHSEVGRSRWAGRAATGLRWVLALGFVRPAVRAVVASVKSKG